MKCLQLGCGFAKPVRKLIWPGTEDVHVEWTRLDYNEEVKPDVVFDLAGIETGSEMPFEPNTFDEIHAYSVLEHFGQQGDFRGFFSTFNEFWRILKPGGFFVGGTPAHFDTWAWGDPGHTRVINASTLVYLTNVAREEPYCDYHRFLKGQYWQVMHTEIREESNGFYFAIRKVV